MVSDIPRQPVNVIASFNQDGKIMPLYFQITEGGENHSIKIEDCRMPFNDSQSTVSNSFKCQYEFNGTIRYVVLTYFFRNHTWYLDEKKK